MFSKATLIPPVAFCTRMALIPLARLSFICKVSIFFLRHITCFRTDRVTDAFTQFLKPAAVRGQILRPAYMTLSNTHAPQLLQNTYGTHASIPNPLSASPSMYLCLDSLAAVSLELRGLLPRLLLVCFHF